MNEAADKRRFTQSTKMQRQQMIQQAINRRRGEIERRRARKSQESSGGLGGAIGTGLGALAGLALAPATGGASTALLAGGLGASVGGSMGQAITGGANPGAGINYAIQNSQLPLYNNAGFRGTGLESQWQEAMLRQDLMAGGQDPGTAIAERASPLPAPSIPTLNPNTIKLDPSSAGPVGSIYSPYPKKRNQQ
jgi:hypothetical protein